MYGTGTRSYNRSTEARQMKKSRKTFTAEWMANPSNRVPIEVGPFCRCPERPWPHPAHSDETMIFEYHRSLRYVSDLQRPHSAAPQRTRLHPLQKKGRTRR